MLDTIKVEYYYATLCLAEDSFLFLAERLLHDFISSLLLGRGTECFYVFTDFGLT